MRAAVLTSTGQIALVDDRSEPQVGPADVVVQVAATGICGTDLAYVHGHREVPAHGLVLGHEPWGTIVEVGSSVDRSRIGERVAVEPNYPCGECRPCLSDAPALCLSRRSPVVNEDGFLAERVAVPAAFAWPLPDTISDRDASCIEPLTVAMAAIRRAGDLATNNRVAIVGAGGIGRILADVLLRRGMTPAVLDRSAERVELALAQGARAVDTGEQFDVIFETSGSGAAASHALSLLDAGGRFVVVGVGTDPLQIDTTTLVRRGLRIIGSMTYDHPIDFPESIRAVAAGEASPGLVLGQPFSLEQAAEALNGAATAPTKSWIRVGGAS